MPGTRAWIDTIGVVTRVIHGRRNGDRGPALGIAFGALSADEERLLRGALQVFPPILPARSARVDYAATAALIALA